jgi:hypothetical protein
MVVSKWVFDHWALAALSVSHKGAIAMAFSVLLLVNLQRRSSVVNVIFCHHHRGKVLPRSEAVEVPVEVVSNHPDSGNALWVFAVARQK